jgi:hypothetical protein
MALDPGLIGENLLLGTAVRALVEFHSKPSEVLTGTSDRHIAPPPSAQRFLLPFMLMIKLIFKAYHDLNHIEAAFLSGMQSQEVRESLYISLRIWAGLR